jgi:hypothetical protein
VDGRKVAANRVHKDFPMDVSSVSSPTPAAPVQASTSKPEQSPDDSMASAASAYQPPSPPPLPPGQGTRIDQLV